MSFDHTRATPEQLQERRDKLKRRAELITDQEHLDQILKSFPPKLRGEILAEIQPLLSFTAAPTATIRSRTATTRSRKK